MFGHTLHAVAIIAIVLGFVWLVARDSALMREDQHGASSQDPAESGALEDDRGGEDAAGESHPDPVESGPLEDEPERQ